MRQGDSGNVRGLIRAAAERLSDAGVDTPALDARVLLSHAAGMSRTEIIAHPERALPAESAELFLSWVDRRIGREPLAYIIGEREFYGLSFHVSPAVLIPRQETEILVETVVDLVRDLRAPIIADIGVGSGAIAVSIAVSCPEASVYGVDSSSEALRVAALNAERAGVAGRVFLSCGDLLAPLTETRFDVVCSNPPYIPTAEIDSLQPEVARFEPRGALDGGPDGLVYYRRLARDCPGLLATGGSLVVEVGCGQADDVQSIFAAEGLGRVRAARDYSGIERVVVGERVGRV